jgi:hypothetical protein
MAASTARTVKDVNPHEFVKAYSAHLKRSGKVTLHDSLTFPSDSRLHRLFRTAAVSGDDLGRIHRRGLLQRCNFSLLKYMQFTLVVPPIGFTSGSAS